MKLHRATSISDPSNPGEARRAAIGIATAASMDEADTGRVALVVTEVATNILKHAGKGYVLLKSIEESEGGPGVEIIGLDRGRGMPDLAECLRDGFSTAGSPGTGLGAISRLASHWDVYTAPERGTAIVARVLRKGNGALGQPAFCAGAIRTPAPGESQCGDDWAVLSNPDGLAVLVVDGLGHGPEAAKAAAAAVRVFCPGEPPDAVLRRVHLASQSTRGVAASCAAINFDAQTLEFAGVGNVAGLLAWPGGTKNLIGQNGTLGGQIGRVRTNAYAWARNACLIMHTDGLTTSLSPQAYPGLLTRDPSLIAAVLYRDFVRGRDDATILVIREARAQE